MSRSGTPPRRNISLKGETYRRLRTYSKQTGRSMSSLLEEWISEVLPPLPPGTILHIDPPKSYEKNDDIPPSILIL